MSLPEYAFFQGEVRKYQDCKVGLLTNALNYGTACFGGLRGYWNDEEEQLFVFRMSDHFARFLNSARLLMIDTGYTPDDLIAATLELLRAEEHRRDCYIRPLAFLSDEAIGVKLNDQGSSVSIVTVPFGRYVDAEEGAHVTFSAWRRVDDNAIPARGKIAGAYVNSAFIKTDALLSGFDEALVLNQDGHLSEGSAENVFVIRDGVAATPRITDNVLEGITRRTVMQMLRDDIGIEVQERAIDRTEVFLADEVFFCGTGVQIAAITRVDHRPIGAGKMGPVVSDLRDIYFDTVRGKVAKYRHWCTPVYVAEAETAAERVTASAG
ncbi:MAG: branched-chain amino acid transaminase [Anaerolineales bacterium]